LTINKSDIIKQLKKSYPNFRKLDLERLVSIVLNEIKQALKRNERVELRGHGIYETHIQKARISRNPATGERVATPEKKSIHFRMSKEMFKILNDEK
jgi:integration host factor subunit beta